MRRLSIHQWHRSLQGRLLGVLIAALAGATVVLVVWDFVGIKNGLVQRQALKALAQGLGEALGDADADVAAAIVRSTELQFNRSRQQAGLDGIEDLLFQLQALDGRVVYASPALKQWPAVTVREVHGQDVQVDGRAYWPGWHDTPRWRVLVLEPSVQDVRLLRWLGAGVLPSVLIAAPLLLLPLWWAVRQGLKPLRQLVEALGKRSEGDLCPLGVDLRYLELQPIVQAIDALLAQARESVARDAALVQNAAHELRTPLAVISAQAFALTGAPDEGAREAARQGVERGVRRATHLVDQLLVLSAVESAAAVVWQPVDLVPMCQQHLIDLEPLARSRGAELALDSPQALRCQVVQQAISSVIDNLVRNALVHGQEGVRVELRLERRGSDVHLQVQDDGPGMPASERAHAFERFFRGRQAAGPGAGLGLSIVYQAALQLKGRVHLEDGAQGRGLRVCVQFPFVPPETAKGPSQRAG